MDVLSEVLRAVKLEGALFFNGEFSTPWSFVSPRSAVIAPFLAPSAEHMIVFHFLTEGHAYARLPDGKREELSAGDIVIFPHGDAHIMGNGAPEQPVDALQLFGKYLPEGLKLVHFGGGGEATRFVCGFLACDPRLSEIFLTGLPRLIKVRISGEPSGQWLANSIRFLNEGTRGGAGSDLVLARLSEVLLAETLRCYINSLPAEQTGWLGGARDEVIGKALAFLHNDPARAWTIADLARQVGVSRTKLADRFTHFLGLAPMAYLGRWRLKLGAEILRSGGDSVAEVALAVGYQSEAAFNRAFKREYACPPAQYRREQKAAPQAAKKTSA